MPFLVQACLDDHTLAVTSATAKEAFAKAVEWSIAERVTDVSIYMAVEAIRLTNLHRLWPFWRLQKRSTPLPSRRLKANDAGRLWLTTAGSENSRIRYRSRRTRAITLRDAADYITSFRRRNPTFRNGKRRSKS